MSLITRCPACETMFKVVPDQLRVSEGWVRCGQCDEIFDASVHLQEGEFPASVRAAAHEPQATLSQVSADSHPASAALEAEPDGDALTAPSPEQEPDPLETGTPDPVTSLVELVPEGRWDAVEKVSTGTKLKAALAAVPEPLEPAFTHPLPSSRSERPEVSFIRKARPRSVWRKQLVRWSLLVASLVLVLALVVQVVVHERDRIVVTEPAFKPWVQAVCAVLACTLAPLKQIESMVIDSSSFNKIRGDAYRLNFTLKNTALTELATPTIELTLTDSQDRPVIRRVFTPSEVGLTSRALAPGSETSGSLAVSVRTTGANEHIAGYRVLAFYP